VRVRSTGLGNTEMVLGISEIKRGADCLILQGRTTEPVKWHIRMAVSYRDIWQIFKLLVFSTNLFFLIWKTLTFKSTNNISWPNDF